NHLLGTIRRPCWVRYFWVIPIPGVREPIAYPLLSVVCHVVDTQRIGWQATTYRNRFRALPHLLITIVMNSQRFPLVSGNDPVRATSIPRRELPLSRRRQG